MARAGVGEPRGARRSSLELAPTVVRAPKRASGRWQPACEVLVSEANEGSAGERSESSGGRVAQAEGRAKLAKCRRNPAANAGGWGGSRCGCNTLHPRRGSAATEERPRFWCRFFRGGFPQRAPASEETRREKRCYSYARFMIHCENASLCGSTSSSPMKGESMSPAMRRAKSRSRATGAMK